MLVEEFRMHSRLFGSRRFVLFPLFTAALVGVGVWLLSGTDVSLDLISALAFDEWPLLAAGVAVGLAVLAGLAGLALSRRTGPRWHERLRTAS
jgi:hypothetical protein